MADNDPINSAIELQYQELLEKYNALLSENKCLKEENSRFKNQLGLSPSEPSEKHSTIIPTKTSCNDASTDESFYFNINHTSDAALKIELFMSLFKGRDDVYAARWENKKKGTFGYAPVCLNQWQTGVCSKPRLPCSKCAHKRYADLDELVIEDHLRGNIVAGIYPMLPDETCCFLAMDFDEDGWQNDVSKVREVCVELNLPVCVERSRSGNGGHAWFFFENPVPASLARKFGTALLTASMNRRHEIRFKSYDRLFPSQDTMPKGGFGNLIALPFQKVARANHNSEFVDENFEAYSDQWAFLSSIEKISEKRITYLIGILCDGNELGELKIDDEETPKPWKMHSVKLKKSDFPNHIDLVKANMLFVEKDGISQRGLTRLKRLASFQNPMFYKQQAMRLSTYGHSRVISCADETSEYLCLPRGCANDLKFELESLGISFHTIDKTNSGRRIDVEFNGALRDEQPLALEQLLRYDKGILCGTTAFGKTVVAIKLIAERKVNTLILVDKISLLSQWRDKLYEFLIINEVLPETHSQNKKRGRKKKISIIGQLGGGKNNLSGIVDIAVMQSISRQGDVKDCVRDYGMIIADECHHASAFTYENILKTTTAKYVYGLTATPTRKDGRHPILTMHLGPIRYRDNAIKQAEKRPFEHYIIPRFTSFKAPLDKDENEITIQEWYAQIVDDDFRNKQIVEDVLKSNQEGRNCLVLSLRTAHVQWLAEKLEKEASNVITLTGKLGVKKTREAFSCVTETPFDQNFILVATGSFIGEGFDEPRLDTLFLAMPISWRGTLQQYAGRLHRLIEGKKDVRIYDYVDFHVKMLEKMYQKRLKGYASMGYKVKGEMPAASLEIIFNQDSFLPVFTHDAARAKKEILIVSPFVRKRRTAQMIKNLNLVLGEHIQIIVVIRPVSDFKQKDQGALQSAIDFLNDKNVSVVYRSNIHQKFAVMDREIVWYGSINLLSYGSALESIMRIESSSIAHELMKSVETR